MTENTPQGIQTWIHFFEEGAGKLWLGRLLLAVCATAVVVVYHFMEARNFMTATAMDQAQLGRNLAEHRGYTTWNIRPLSVHLLQEKARETGGSGNGLLKQPHPDLENPPVYPVVLAGLFKMLPEKFRSGTAAEPVAIHRLPPEMAISWMNLALFLVVVAQVYLLGKRLFNPAVATLAATVTFGTELLWRFTYSGLSTMLLMVFVLLLTQVLVALERGARATPVASGRRQILLAALAGLTIGAACLTRYPAGLLLVPTVAFLLCFGEARRWSGTGAAVLAFLLVVSPWLVRNWHLSGQPFGTAGYALFAGTETFPEDRLARSFNPQMGAMQLREPWQKIIAHSLDQLQDDVPRMAGGWIAAFFLAGLLVPFRDPGLSRLRWFVLGALGVLFLAQAAGRTQLSELVPAVNAENLMVLLAPLVFLFGAAFFELLLDQIEFPFPLMRSIAYSGGVLVFTLPLLVALASDALAIPGWMSRRQFPLAEPYRPSVIRELCDYTPRGSLLVSDVPWAVAWYGGRECVTVPLRVQDGYKEDFFVVHDYQRPVQALYLSPLTADARFLTSFFDTENDYAWFRFFGDVALRGRLPDGFPLKNVFSPSYVAAGHLFCSEKAWWLPPDNR